VSDSPKTAAGAKAGKPKPKYKVGDYLTADDSVIMRVDAVIADDPYNPLYGVSHEKRPDREKDTLLQWATEYELDHNPPVYHITPEWDKWAKVKAGDLIHVGTSIDKGYVKVLARVGNLVMLSSKPTTRKEKESLNRIAGQIEDLTDGKVTKIEITKTIGKDMELTTSEAHKTANSYWWTTEQLARMHWELLGGDE
jgi:hypothetical protein